MNSTSQDSQTRLHNASPGLIDVVDPTEDLANDVTSELPGSGPSGTRVRVLLPRPAASGSSAANDEAGGNGAVMTTGAVLRDRYSLGPPLGYGGTSVVFRARDLRRADSADEGADVAIKLLRPEFRDQPHCIARLRREFHQTQSVAHPGVVRFYDLDCDQGNWFIAMELLEGESLGRRLRHVSPQGLPSGEALRIAAACGDALGYAHNHGVIHGDVKPDNIFITRSGEIRMLDFGVALGAATRAYASPEVLAGQAPESRDDVFSLACVVYELLAGEHPFGRRGADEVQQAGLEIMRPPGLSARQWRALAAGLAWKRENRPTVHELALAPVQAEAAAVTVLPVHASEGPRSGRPYRRWRGPALIGIAIVLGVLLGRFAFVSQGEAGPGPGVTSPPMTVDASSANTPAVEIAPATDASQPARVEPPAAPQAVSAPAVETGAEGSLTPGLVAFDSETMTVSRRAVVAPVPVRHFIATRGSATVAWRVLAGTALPGRDYGGPESGVAHFSEGHTFRMIFVPLLGDAKITGDRSFTVELTEALPGASLGMTQQIVVTILGDA